MAEDQTPVGDLAEFGQAESAHLYPDDLRELVELRLASLRFVDDQKIDGLAEAMRYSLLAGGKRIRPVLALATARAIGDRPEAVLPFAAALELIHTYSLIHDDLPAMDDDDLRRGRPTCHKVFGENVAILAGDALFAEALNLVVSDQPGEPPALIAAVRELLDATGAAGMVGGQYIDVIGEIGDRDSLRHLHELKTGRLIVASVKGAALVLGAGHEQIERLTAFAAELGVLFQIIDDILDVTGTDADLGKPQGSDERHGKSTYVSMFGMQKAQQFAGESYERAKSALIDAPLDGDRSGLLALTDFIYTRNN